MLHQFRRSAATIGAGTLPPSPERVHTGTMATLARPIEPQTETGLVSVQEYLHTAYSPDCDLVDGHVEERNLGEFDHATLQGILLLLLLGKQKEWGVRVLPECRLQVRPDRFRVPDVMVLRAEQKVDRIVREAPLLCIEVLSPEDTWKRFGGRITDYLAMGVAHVWVFDPYEREAFRCDAEGYHRIHEPALTIPGTEIRLDLETVFAALDS